MRLEIFSQRNEDIFCLLQIVGCSQLEVVERQGDGEVEAVVSGLVRDDELKLLQAEIRQIDVVFGRGDEVAQLSDLCLEGDFVE